MWLRLRYIYGYLVITYSRVWINRVRLPILLVVSWTGKMNIPLSAFASENLASRDSFGRPVPRQPVHLHTQAESGAYSRDSSRFSRRHRHIIPSTAIIGPVPSLSGHATAYRWRSLPRFRRRRARSPQGSSSNGCCLFRFHRGPINVRLSFPTPTTIVM